MWPKYEHNFLHANSNKNWDSYQFYFQVYQYAYVRGVIVLPEFDAPAHVGEGWQQKNVTACYNAQPWSKFCVEPPCGQLDPSKDALYPILEDIYREYYELFHDPDVFHMGGDEVSHACWNTSSEIQNFMKERGWNLQEADFMKLWNHFQSNALERLDKVAKRKVPIIMWTSHLTQVPYVDQYLDKSRYIIQVKLCNGFVKWKQNSIDRNELWIVIADMDHWKR